MKFQAEGKKPILHGIKVGIGMIAVTKMYETLENVIIKEPRVFSSGISSFSLKMYFL